MRSIASTARTAATFNVSEGVEFLAVFAAVLRGYGSASCHTLSTASAFPLFGARRPIRTNGPRGGGTSAARGRTRNIFRYSRYCPNEKDRIMRRMWLDPQRLPGSSRSTFPLFSVKVRRARQATLYPASSGAAFRGASSHPPARVPCVGCTGRTSHKDSSSQDSHDREGLGS